MRLRSHVAVAVVSASGYSSNLTPGLGPSIHHRCGPKETKKKKKRKEKKMESKLSRTLSGTKDPPSLVACFFFFLFRAAPATYGSSQARDRRGAAAASLHHSHSHARSELHLLPTLQLVATPDP